MILKSKVRDLFLFCFIISAKFSRNNIRLFPKMLLLNELVVGS